MAVDWSKVSPKARAGIDAFQEAQKYNPISASHDIRQEVAAQGKSIQQAYYEKSASAAAKTSYGGSSPEQTRIAAVETAERKAVQAAAEHISKTGGSTTVQLTKQRLEVSQDPRTGGISVGQAGQIGRTGPTQRGRAAATKVKRKVVDGDIFENGEFIGRVPPTLGQRIKSGKVKAPGKVKLTVDKKQKSGVWVVTEGGKPVAVSKVKPSFIPASHMAIISPKKEKKQPAIIDKRPAHVKQQFTDFKTIEGKVSKAAEKIPIISYFKKAEPKAQAQIKGFEDWVDVKAGRGVGTAAKAVTWLPKVLMSTTRLPERGAECYLKLGATPPKFLKTESPKAAGRVGGKAMAFAGKLDPVSAVTPSRPGQTRAGKLSETLEGGFYKFGPAIGGIILTAGALHVITPSAAVAAGKTKAAFGGLKTKTVGGLSKAAKPLATVAKKAATKAHLPKELGYLTGPAKTEVKYAGFKVGGAIKPTVTAAQAAAKKAVAPIVSAKAVVGAKAAALKSTVIGTKGALGTKATLMGQQASRAVTGAKLAAKKAAGPFIAAKKGVAKSVTGFKSTIAGTKGAVGTKANIISSEAGKKISKGITTVQKPFKKADALLVGAKKKATGKIGSAYDKTIGSRQIRKDIEMFRGGVRTAKPSTKYVGKTRGSSFKTMSDIVGGTSKKATITRTLKKTIKPTSKFVGKSRGSSFKTVGDILSKPSKGATIGKTITKAGAAAGGMKTKLLMKVATKSAAKTATSIMSGTGTAAGIGGLGYLSRERKAEMMTQKPQQRKATTGFFDRGRKVAGVSLVGTGGKTKQASSTDIISGKSTGTGPDIGLREAQGPGVSTSQASLLGSGIATGMASASLWGTALRTQQRTQKQQLTRPPKGGGGFPFGGGSGRRRGKRVGSRTTTIKKKWKPSLGGLISGKKETKKKKFTLGITARGIL